MLILDMKIRNDCFSLSKEVIARTWLAVCFFNVFVSAVREIETCTLGLNSVVNTQCH